MKYRVGAVVAAAVTGATVIGSCASPTQFNVVVQSTLRCDELAGVAIDVGPDAKTLEDTAKDSPQATATNCKDNADGSSSYGNIYLVPGQDQGALLVRAAIKGGSVEKCDSKLAPQGCIFARRRFTYLTHKTLTMTVTLDRQCLNVSCSEESTCEKGKCVAPTVECVDTSCRVNPDASVPKDDKPIADAGTEAAPDVKVIPVEAGPPGVVQVAAGVQATCAVLEDGRVKCWGNNNHGQLGLGDKKNRGGAPSDMGANLPAVDLGTGLQAASVCMGTFHTCALLRNGRVKCWGSPETEDATNPSSLGLGDNLSRGVSPGQMGDALPYVELDGEVADLSCGDRHTCVVLKSGAAKCWGQNQLGQLGIGSTVAWLGDKPGQMGTNLPAVLLGGPALSVHAGALHTCARRDDKTLRCWGQGDHGILGLGDAISRGMSVTGMGADLPPVSLGVGRTVVGAAAGDDQTCVVLDDGAAKCWGRNLEGYLGLGDTVTRGGTPDTMGDLLPRVPVGAAVLEVTTQGPHVCVLRADRRVSCWGANPSGALGFGDHDDRGKTPAPTGGWPAVDLGEMAAGAQVARVTAGFIHTCAVFTNKQVKCWGDNSLGELGLGDIQNRGDEPGQMGATLPFLKLD